MKKRILVHAVLALLAGKISATTITVSNDALGGAQYSTLTAAYTAASSANDTILIEGTNTVYAVPASWAKSLVIIGIGFDPSKANPRTTKLNGLTLSASGNGSKFYGIEFTQAVNQNTAISNYAFEDCRFNASLDINANTNIFTFKNCIFLSYLNFYGGTLSNFLFNSCIFNSYIYGGNITTNTPGWLTVDFSLFLGNNGSYFDMYQVFFAQVTNSIFMNTSAVNGPTNATGGNNVFNNNIFRLYPNQLPTAQSGYTNTGSGNLPSTNPNFVTYTLGTTYNQAHNYHLQAGSSAIGAATNGSDIGPHGSTTNFNERGEVLITPIIRTLNINNASVVPNGTLNVQINATKPNDN